MALAHERPDVSDAGQPDGRPDDLAAQPGSQIAGILKGDNARLIDLLGESYVPIPWERCLRDGTHLLPEDVKFEFLGKDLGRAVRSQWAKFPMGEEGLTMRDRWARALGVYDWVIQNRPKAIVVWTDQYPEPRAAVLAGKGLRIPTFEIVHGGFRAYQPGNPHVSALANWKLGSWAYREWHKDLGLPGRAIATGTCPFDSWARGNLPVARAVARSTFRIPESAPVVCFLEDASFERGPWDEPAFARHIRDNVLWAYKQAEAIVPDLHLIVKLHPYESSRNAHEYQHILRKMGITHNYTIVDDELPGVLSASDLTIGARSSAMVQGLMLGLPAILVDFRPFFETWAYEGRGFEVVRETGELLSILVRALTDSNRMGTLIAQTKEGARWFGADGLSSLRAKRTIDLVLQGKEPDEDCWIGVER